MPSDFPRMPDPADEEYAEPDGLARLRARYTWDKQLRDFRQIFGRDPASDEELDAFVEEYTREMYNNGHDEID